MIYTLDTNVLVEAVRRPVDLEQLKHFLSWALPQTALSSVVATELLAGARTEAARRFVERDLLGAFDRRGRIIAPSVEAWTKTGLLLGRFGGGSIGAQWQNDLLIAYTARERGWCVITRDKDFERIRLHIRGLRVAAPYPRRPNETGPAV